PPPPRLHVPLRLTDRVVRPASGPKPVAVLAEGRIEDRLHHLQNGLLDEPIEHRRDPQLPDPAATLRYLVPSYRRRLVASREQLRPDPLPVLPQVFRQLLHAHSIDARTPLVAPHALQRSDEVVALDDLRHQVAVS